MYTLVWPQHLTSGHPLRETLRRLEDGPSIPVVYANDAGSKIRAFVPAKVLKSLPDSVADADELRRAGASGVQVT